MSKHYDKKSGSKQIIQHLRKLPNELLKTPRPAAVEDGSSTEAQVPPLPSVEELQKIMDKLQLAKDKARKTRNLRKEVTKLRAALKSPAQPGRHLRPRTAKRRALKAVKHAEMVERRQQRQTTAPAVVVS